MSNEFGLKELYQVLIKTTYPIEMNGRKIETGEVIAAFDKIQLANFQEIKSIASARGGAGNAGLVWWEETKEIKLNFTQGVFSKEQFSLMTNSKLSSLKSGEEVVIPVREIVESNENGIIELKQSARSDIFIYNEQTGEKIIDWTKDGNSINIGIPFTSVIVDYSYSYTDSAQVLTIGQQFTNGFLSLTAKTRVKDETTGQVKTGIINIPKLKLMSDLSMRLGSDAIPLVGRMDAVAIPVGNRGQKRAMEIIFLGDDIDSDM